METKTETHNQTTHRERETLEHLVLNGTSSNKPSPQDSGNYAEEEPEGLDATKGNNRTVAHMNSREYSSM